MIALALFLSLLALLAAAFLWVLRAVVADEDSTEEQLAADYGDWDYEKGREL